MEDMQAALKLCGCLGRLSPKEVCQLQASCSELLETAVPWNNFTETITVDMSDASYVRWLQKVRAISRYNRTASVLLLGQ